LWTLEVEKGKTYKHSNTTHDVEPKAAMNFDHGHGGKSKWYRVKDNGKR